MSEQMTRIAEAARKCATAWEPDVALIGNVTAAEIMTLCDHVLSQPPAPRVVVLDENVGGGMPFDECVAVMWDVAQRTWTAQETEDHALRALIGYAKHYAALTPRAVVTEEIPKSLRDKWHREKGNGMTSAVGEYTPGEFWMLLDAYEAQLEECAFLQAGAERSMQAHADALRQLTAALAVAPAPTANGGGEVARG